MRLTKRQRLLFFGPLGVVVGIGLVAPIVLGFLATFTSFAPGLTSVRFTGLANYAAVLRDREFLTAIRNIAVFTIVAVPLELAIGFALAYLLRRPFRGRAILRVALLIPWLVSPVASGVMWHFLLGSGQGMLDFGLAVLGVRGDVPSPLSQDGLAMAALIAVEVWRVAPLVAFLLLPGLTAIAPDLWEQTTIDGASVVGRIRAVALPAIRPLGLAVTMLLIAALYSYSAAFQVSNWPIGAASAWLIVGAVLIVGAMYLSLTRRPA